MAETSRLGPGELWPELPYDAWSETCATLHMWTQIVGKLRLALSPPQNHWWQVPLYVSGRGLTTSPMPYRGLILEVAFDFLDHNLLIQIDDGRTKVLPLYPRSVADFHREFTSVLRALEIEVVIHGKPNEVPDPIPFAEDTRHAAYDAEYANRFWRALVQADTVFKEFRGRFLGKSSPVHFFWGSFDLAVTRFSGRRAPERKGADWITREAYSHEVSSCGLWPGGGEVRSPMFYAYGAPEPLGFGQARVRPAQARYETKLSEYLLPYDDVRQAPSPREALLDFCQSTYEAQATLAKWDRAELER